MKDEYEERKKAIDAFEAKKQDQRDAAAAEKEKAIQAAEFDEGDRDPLDGKDPNDVDADDDDEDDDDGSDDEEEDEDEDEDEDDDEEKGDDDWGEWIRKFEHPML